MSAGGEVARRWPSIPPVVSAGSLDLERAPFPRVNGGSVGLEHLLPAVQANRLTGRWIALAPQSVAGIVVPPGFDDRTPQQREDDERYAEHGWQLVPALIVGRLHMVDTEWAGPDGAASRLLLHFYDERVAAVYADAIIAVVSGRTAWWSPPTE